MSTTFSGGKYGAGPYGGQTPPPFLPVIPVLIELYDNNLGYKGAYQTGVGGFVGVKFTLDESGPVNFTLIFTGPQIIVKRDIIKIKLFGIPDYFFTGVVRNTPIAGSTKAEFNYTGFGLNDYLLRVNTESKNYITKTLAYILDDILDTIIIPKTPINKNNGKINPPDITITSFTVNYSQIPDVLDALKNVANSSGEIYHSGVDETGDFFFKPKPIDTVVTLVVGARGKYGIPSYEPQDEFEAITKLFILDDNGNLVTTVSSTEENDILEEKALAPQLGAADILKWGEGILAEREINRRQASVDWPIEEADPIPLLGHGAVRIISNIPPTDPTPPNSNPFGSGVFGSELFGGGQIDWETLNDTLLVKETAYTLTGAESIRSISLGAVPVRVTDQIIKLNKKILNLVINIGK